MFVRSSKFIIPDLLKALPSRPPETFAQKQTKQMMTGGGAAPNPVKSGRAIGGIYCPSCGSHHAAGTLCGNKSVDEVIDILKAVTNPGKKGGIPGHTGGNPFHGDDGKFSTEGEASMKTPKVGKPAVPVEDNPNLANMKQPGIAEEMAGPDIGKISDKEWDGKRAKGRAMREAGKKKNAQREADKQTAADKKQYQNEVHFVIGGNNSDKPSFEEWRAKKNAPKPDLANMPQPGQVDPKAKTEMAPAPKKQRPVEYYDPSKPQGESSPKVAPASPETDDFIPSGDDQPKARPEASTLRPNKDGATNPGSPVAKQPKKEFAPIPGMSPVAAAEKDFNPNPNDIGAFSQHASNLKQQGVSEEEAAASANKVAENYIANKKNKVVSGDPNSKETVTGEIDNYDSGNSSVGNEPKVQVDPGLKTPLQSKQLTQFDSGQAPNPNSTGPGDVFSPNAGGQPATPWGPLNPPGGSSFGSSGGAGSGGGSSFASNTSGATSSLNNMSPAMVQNPQQPGMPIPFSQLYGAGASMGSGLGTPGGSAAPTAGFVAQRTHGLLNPAINSAAGPGIAGPRYLGQPHLQSQSQTQKSLNNLQEWLNSRGK